MAPVVQRLLQPTKAVQLGLAFHLIVKPALLSIYEDKSGNCLTLREGVCVQLNGAPDRSVPLAASVAVIIPTVGRASLEAAVASVASQEPHPDRIIVVDDSSDGLPPRRLESFRTVTVVRGARKGPAAARNVGLEYVRAARWIAFLDDDDLWLPSKLRKQLELGARSPNSIISCASLVIDGAGNSRLRPSVFPDPQMSILEMFFGKWRMRGSPYYIPTASLLVPTAQIDTIRFDERLAAREDVWWVHCLQSRGLNLLQLHEALVIVNSSGQLSRGASRDALLDQLDWAKRLEGYSPGFGRNFLAGVATRDALLQRRFIDAARLTRQAFGSKDRNWCTAQGRE